jgi:hypothetical protein
MLTFEHLLMGFTGHGASRTFAEVPQVCPLCHHHVDPRRLSAHCTSPDGEAVDFAFQCPRTECRRVFVGRYRTGPDGPFELLSVAPLTVRREAFSDEIRTFSPAFVEVYDQAQEAEARGLHQVAGIGLRKALELLVKEYAREEAPEAEDEIRRMPLGECLRRCVSDASVLACANRASWLGDDEALFLRRWDEHDLDELRVLIRLTINWLENVLLARRFVASAA